MGFFFQKKRFFVAFWFFLGKTARFSEIWQTTLSQSSKFNKPAIGNRECAEEHLVSEAQIS
jgi:hypothetical protein